MEAQLGRRPRGAVAVAYRTPDGQPAVVTTWPRLPDGTPFPTLYYLTDPRLTAEASRLEVAGVMKTMQARLAEDPDLAADYQRAHEHYLATRNAMEDLGTDFSGGGMPDRVKCIHVLMAYALAEGPEHFRLGAEAVALAAENNPPLRGTAIPADWPTSADLGTSMEQASADQEVTDQARAARKPRRFAAIDCGTNSIRLLISEVSQSGEVKELHRDNIIVRLGEGVDATGEFAPAALQRVDDALATYTQRMRDYGVLDVMMGATSASRDAANKDDFFALTRRHLGRIRDGLCAEVISGVTEAKYSFAGAVSDWDRLGEDTPSEGICVVDLGGGSTEFVIDADQAHSADMGCVRITERFLHDTPPTAEQLAAAREFVAEKMREVRGQVDASEIRAVVGVAGTLTTMAALTQGLDSYASEKIHMSRVPVDALRAVAEKLASLTPEQRLEFGPMHPGRADVIGGGAVVVQAVCDLCDELGIAEVVVSEKDILDGMLAEVIRRNS